MLVLLVIMGSLMFQEPGTPAREQTTPDHTNPATEMAPPPDVKACALHGQNLTARVSLVIDAQGKPQEVAIAKSSGNDCVDQSVIKAVNQYKFKPAMEAGVARAQKVNIEVNVRTF